MNEETVTHKILPLLLYKEEVAIQADFQEEGSNSKEMCPLFCDLKANFLIL